MFELILIELKKVLTKKSIYVMLFIMLLFCGLNNILYYTDYDSDGNYKYLDSSNIEEEIDLLEDELDKYDINNSSDKTMIVELTTKIDVLKYKMKYNKGTWQYNKVDSYLYNVLEGINIYTYQIRDDKYLEEYKNELRILLERFECNDWKYFVKLEIGEIEKIIKEYEEKIVLISDVKERLKIEEIIGDYKNSLNILRYRLDNNISYDNSYLNMALTKYIESYNNIKYYEEIDNLSYSERVEYQTIKEELEINKYILDNKINYNKQNNLNYQLRTIVDDYLIFIIIIVLIVSSTIMGDELVSGTIKLLLIKPYSRGKILLSKYFTIIIVMLLSILYLILMQLVIGGVIFGFSSLEIPVIVYNFNSMSIYEYNIFLYMIIRIIVKLPMIVMIGSISYSLSILFSNVVTSVVIPLFIYIFTDSIKYLILQYKLNSLKYLVNITWNFGSHLFGKIDGVEGITLENSIIIYLVYYVVIVFITYINFKNKDIKNI